MGKGWEGLKMGRERTGEVWSQLGGTGGIQSG